MPYQKGTLDAPDAVSVVKADLPNADADTGSSSLDNMPSRVDRLMVPSHESSQASGQALAQAANDQKNEFNRRGLLKFAGVTSLVAIAENLFVNPARAQTWLRLTGTATGGSTHKRVRLPQRGMRKNSAVISGGSSHTVALRSDGLLFACGYNTTGQLGDNTTTNKSTFVQAIGP